MRDEEFVLVLIAMIGGFAMMGGLGYAVFSWLKMRRPGIGAESAQALHEQIAQLQMSVDAMALEVERISEAQRFTTRLLTEAPPEPSRIEGGERRA